MDKDGGNAGQCVKLLLIKFFLLDVLEIAFDCC